MSIRSKTLAGAVVAAVGLVSAFSVAAVNRHVHGVITSVEGPTVTIAQVQGKKGSISGRIDATKTKITMDGRPAKPAELHVTNIACGQLGLDDVWLEVEAKTTGK